MAEDSSNMLDKLTSLLDTKKTPEEIGPAFGDIMTNMMKSIQEMPQDSNPEDSNPEEYTQNMFRMIFGNERMEKIVREKQIQKFLEESLQTHTLTEAVILTKTHFNLTDDFTVKLVLDVTFAPRTN